MAKPQLCEEDREIVGDLCPAFLTLVAEIPDPRRTHRRRHSLASILFVHLSAQMAGITSINGAAHFAAECWPWCQRCLGDDLTDACAPEHDTLGRVLAMLPTDILERLLTQLFGGSAEVTRTGQHIAIDGKLLRGSVLRDLLNVKLADGGRQLMTTVNVYSVDRGIVLTCATSANPGAEHACIDVALGAVSLRGACVSMDAGNAYRKFTDRILAAEADYLIAIKGNNEATRAECDRVFDECDVGVLENTYTEHVARGDKRAVRIQYVDPAARPEPADPKPATVNYARSATEAQAMAEIVRRWPGVKSVVEIERYRDPRRGESTKNKADATGLLPGWTRVYYLCSKVIGGPEAQRLIREHWHVENKLHYGLDVNYGEDRSLARQGFLPRNLAVLRRVAHNILARHTGVPSRVQSQRRFAISERYRNQVWGVSDA